LRPTLNLDLDLGFDSMQRVELLSRLEEELGGNVEESQLTEIYTVRDLVDAVLNSAGTGTHVPGTRVTFAGWKSILAEDPDDPEVLALAHPSRTNDTFWYLVTRLMQIAALDRFQLKVSGLDKLPKQGACIISSNHQSYLDPLILASVLPAELFFRAFAVGTSEIFGKGFMRRLARSIKVVVLDPDANLVPAMRAGAFGLRHGMALVLYPEGERSIDGTPRNFKKGAAILSIHLRVPIVPVAIDGFYEVWPRNQKFRGVAPLRMAFGDPIYQPPESAASEEAYERLTAELKGRIVQMWEVLRKSQ
jgi:long-chain acyl-CoA synthetase